MRIIYVLTLFKNPAWGQRTYENELKYTETKVYKTKPACEKFINKFMRVDGLKVKVNSKCFSGNDRHVDIQQIKV